MKKLENVNYAGSENPMQVLDACFPDEAGFDTLIYFHGGGLKAGSRYGASYLMPLTKEGIAVVTAEYRMYPEVEFPAFIEDAAVCVKYVLEHVKEWGGNGRVFISGASAGAYITMMLCVNKEYLKAVRVDENDIAGFISESAQQFAHFNVMKARGMDGRLERIDETAPIKYVNEGLTIRPTILLWYSKDMWCRPEENKLMRASMLRFLPEGSILEWQVLPGTHCKPDSEAERVEAYRGFIKRIGNEIVK